MIDRFILTDTFIKSLIDIDKPLKILVVKCVTLLEKNTFHPSLHSEKIWDGIYTVRVNLANRIVHQAWEDKIRLLYVGSHNEAYRFIDNLKKKKVLVIHDEKIEYNVKALPVLKRLIKKTGDLKQFCRWVDNLSPKDICITNSTDLKLGLGT